MRRLLRPLLSFVVLAALVFALLQGFGRVAFALLAHAEVAANQLLAARQIRVGGLRGEWRGFNPVVRLARLELPAGHLEDLYVELDLLETLFRSRAVLHRARVVDAALLLEPTDTGGWRLAGMPQGDGFDPLPYLTETDQLQFDGVFAFARDDAPATELVLHYAGINRAGTGRHRLIVRNGAQDCASPCEFRVELQRTDAGWTLGSPELALTASATRFLIPETLLGVASLQLDAVEVDWQETASAPSGGRALVTASGNAVRDGQPFAARVDALARSSEGRRWGLVSRLELEYGRERVALPTLGFEERDGVLHAALPYLPVAELTALIRSALAWNDVADRWLGALALDARAENVQAFYDLDTGELGYRLELAEFDMNGYRGVPWVRNGAGTVVGLSRFRTGRPQAEVGNRVQIDLDAVDMQAAFPDHVRDEWDLPFARGRLQAFFRRDELGFRAQGLETRIGESAVAASVSISRLGADEGDRRIAVLGRIDRVTLAEARRFVPYTLQPRLYEWLTSTPMEGVMEDARIAYQGQFRVPQGEPGRRLEIFGQLRETQIRFHPEWPEVAGFDGYLEVAGREVRATAAAATSLGADLTGTRLKLRDNGAVADVALVASADAAAVLALVRASPMQRWLAFVAPDWSARGPLRATGELSIPLKQAGGPGGAAAADRAVEPSPNLAMALALELEGVDLDLPGYRLQFDDLAGPLTYRYPDDLQSPGITGSLFEAPVRATATSADDRFAIDLAGTARAADLWTVIDLADPGLAAGAARFTARLDIAAPTGAAAGVQAPQRAAEPPKLAVRSTLEGMTLRLPAQYAKLAEDAEPLEVDLAFPADRRKLMFRYRDATGWLSFGERLEQGSVGLGIDPLPVAEGAREVVFTGRLGRIVLNELPLEGGAPGVPPLPIRLRGLDVAELVLGGFATRDAFLEADLAADGFEVRLESERVDGSARRRIDPTLPADAPAAPIEVTVTDLWLPKGSGSGDPLSVDIIPSIPDMDVAIEQMTVGEEDYGSWRFRLRQAGGDLWFRELEGRMRNVDVIGADGVVWRGAANATTFDGQLRMTNLAAVLPLWGYAPSVETEQAELSGSISWSGSPAAFRLPGLSGEARIKAETGRFLDVETGGGTQRILSLLNFTAIAKRMSFDFSDVFGKGLSFDKLKATIGLDQGILEFVKPLDVEGTGIKFRMTGTVRLEERTLDHQMIVTLPVSRGLPWYAAYVGLANPIAGLGVLVGERMLRKPLEQFSSAKYRITGTVENPKVELVSVFDTTASDEPVEVPVEVGPEGPIEVVPSEPVEIRPSGSGGIPPDASAGGDEATKE